MKAFIDEHRNTFGVESICRVLQVTPSMYWRHAASQRNLALHCHRARRDEVLVGEIPRIWQANSRVYEAAKVWRQLNREGVRVARCAVERLMRRHGMRGAVRGKVVKTTQPDLALAGPQDWVKRQFSANRPNQLQMADFTYVSTWRGFAYVAFVIDVYARCIVGWLVSRHMQTDFVLDALEQALYARQPDRDSLIRHSDRESQYVSIRYAERLAEAGIEPSVSSRGDSYDNALTASINGLYKTEVIHRQDPQKSLQAVELATLEWVCWLNHHRLLDQLGHVSPAEAEASYYQHHTEQATVA